MTKRFIAGAVCPRCGAQDSIRAERDEEKHVLNRDCVECDFTDALYDTPQSEIKTRVTPPDPLADVPAQPINIMDPGKTKH